LGDILPEHVIIESREDYIKRNRKIFKILILWVIPLFLLFTAIGWIAFPGVMSQQTINDAYTLAGICILWLIGSFYLRKKRGKWF
jgi:hypothetical protein